jgi:N-acetylmuramic acid 6-phosphate etherase
MNHPGIRVDSPTETVNPRTVDLDTVPTIELVRLINDEDLLVPKSVSALLPELAALVDAAAERVAAGGRVHYYGAGTSGRLAVLDAAELLPTFSVANDVVVAHQAGGPGAFLTAVEGAEDTGDAADIVDLTAADTVVGLSASGRTPYVGAALAGARAAGALTALVTSNPDAPLADLADHLLATDTGPEALTGSTRLKAGTAQKLILNTFSTALMVRLGRTYGNFMIDMQPTNAKLRGRSVQMLVQAAGAPTERAEAALELCGDLKTALVFLLTRGSETGPSGPDPERCRTALAAAGGKVRPALASLGVAL